METTDTNTNDSNAANQDRAPRQEGLRAARGYANESQRRTENGAGSGGLKYSPIFEGHGVRFIFPYKDCSADDEEEAWKIGWGMALVDGIILGFKFHGEVFAWKPDGKPQCQQGDLGPHRIAVVGDWGEVLRAKKDSSHTKQISESGRCADREKDK